MQTSFVSGQNFSLFRDVRTLQGCRLRFRFWLRGWRSVATPQVTAAVTCCSSDSSSGMVAAEPNQLYTHNTEPKAVGLRQSKLPNQNDVFYPANIMYDRRVVRGNTYSAQVLPADMVLQDTKQRTKRAMRTEKASVPRTPQPVAGRQHMDIQTDSYLEELTDAAAEAEAVTQTDAFMDRPATPLFIPAKQGVDATTQIEGGDLFDFDFEVEPLLEVLVGGVLEQGLMEVMEEEELAAMRSHQHHFEQVRAAELAAVQRMEAAEKRKFEERERRLAQARGHAEAERKLRQKVAAATFARGYLRGLIGSVYSHLSQTGFFYDPVQREVEQDFMPWLQAETQAALAKTAVARQAVNQIVADALARQSEQAQALAAAREAARRAAEEQAAKAAAAQAEADAWELEGWKGSAAQVLASLQADFAEKITQMREKLAGQVNAEEPAAASDADVVEALISQQALSREAVRNALTASAAPAADA